MKRLHFTQHAHSCRHSATPAVGSLLYWQAPGGPSLHASWHAQHRRIPCFGYCVGCRRAAAAASARHHQLRAAGIWELLPHLQPVAMAWGLGWKACLNAHRQGSRQLEKLMSDAKLQLQTRTHLRQKFRVVLAPLIRLQHEGDVDCCWSVAFHKLLWRPAVAGGGNGLAGGERRQAGEAVLINESSKVCYKAALRSESC